MKTTLSLTKDAPFCQCSHRTNITQVRLDRQLQHTDLVHFHFVAFGLSRGTARTERPLLSDNEMWFVILDRDSRFDAGVIQLLQSTGLRPKRTSVQAPWQNGGIAERWIGSCPRELLDHVIVLSERHLRRLIREYVSYHHDRIHDSPDS